VASHLAPWPDQWIKWTNDRRELKSLQEASHPTPATGNSLTTCSTCRLNLMMAVLGFECPLLAAPVLTVHPKWTHRFPLPNGRADARGMPSVCDPRWPMLSSPSCHILLYILALRSCGFSLYLQVSISHCSDHSTLSGCRLDQNF
jgi:hypothetical protein